MTVESVGGYRLVRKLGEGARAEVFLGYAVSAPAEQADARSVAVKLCKPHATSESIDAEIEALSRGSVHHRVALRDLAEGVDGRPVLILERLPRPSLGRLLHEREVLSPGECVTILAPLASAVGELHEAGVAHGGIRLESIGFRYDGTPVLAGFGRTVLFAETPSIAAIEANDVVAADRRALGAVVRATVERAPALVNRDRFTAWLDLATAGELPEEFTALLTGRLFDLADPTPVRFDHRLPAAAHRVPARVVTPQEADLVDETDAPARRSAALAAFHLPEWLDGAIASRLDAYSVRELSGHVVGSLRQVRKPVWLAAGGVAVALVVALAVIPAGPSDLAVATAPTATPTPFAEDLGDIGSDDPLEALDDLLAARERCVADMSLLCLDGVDERGSGALADDQSLVRALQAGSESVGAGFVSSTPSLVERLGDSALVSLGDVPESQPASVLLMKGEAGWRIRQYLDG